MSEQNADATDAGERTFCVGVVTIAADRDLASDEAGKAVVTGFEAEGHEIAMREHVGPDYDKVQSIVERMIDRDDVDFVVTAGATSIEPEDVTLDAVEPLLEQEITAFDELFTQIGYELIGSQIVATRTLAGVSEQVLVFCLPGDPDAASLAIEDIILPEAAALVDLAREDRTADDDDDVNGDE
ncbi:MogA/MoaB family molybdenum cofactor biosynthesis protein [Halosolutus halophilus]|uniref:MogA/MoaB family molybdenum cofactor biosynthesis protein n=1 Tax=Halosolutus halophilus TaxID=1552990 RepID=UPI002234F7D2|nr:molybdopterin-binding protein [Halosolutus halophilus]